VIGPTCRPYSPQVFFHNEHFPTLRSLRATAAELPPNVAFIRQKSSWTSVANLCDIIRRLAAAVAPWMADFQPILLLDCARQHVHWRVATAAARHRIWLVFVPALMTWLLQPCDTHVFAAYKAFAQECYGEVLAASPSREVSQEDWLRLLGTIVRVFLPGRVWDKAFVQNGFGTQAQGEVRQEILAELGPGPLPAICADRPSADQFCALFPRGWSVPTKHFWSPFDAPPSPSAPTGGAAARSRVHVGRSSLGPPAPLPAPPGPPPDDGEVEGPSVWSGRLRVAPKPSGRAIAAGAHGVARRRPAAAPIPLRAPGVGPIALASPPGAVSSRALPPTRPRRLSMSSSSVAGPRAAP
jgi:hypothetical protein